MSAPQTSEAFWELVRKSGLLPRGQAAVMAGRSAPADPAELAEMLVVHGDLTNFQAERLLQGAYRGFFIQEYKVLDIVGGGGMGVLYLAEQRDTHEKVALKVLSEIYKHDPAMRARFELEGRTGLRLKHPHIAQVEKIGVTDDLYGDVPFIVMEFVLGLELQELSNGRGPLPWPQACDLIRQVANGLHYAHEAGLVHRDIKPANVLIDSSGHVKLLDFGLALLNRDEHDDELSLALIFGQGCVGTDDFISPEQSRDSSAVDRRADIYSLGCMLYFALTGRVPFPGGSTVEKIKAHRSREPQDLLEIVPKTPEGVVAIVRKMMAKLPADRFQTAAEVEQALAPFCVGRQIEFDFSELLEGRKQAVKRRALAHSSRLSRSSTTLKSGTRLSQQKVETNVAQDTPGSRPQSSTAAKPGTRRPPVPADSAGVTPWVKTRKRAARPGEKSAAAQGALQADRQRRKPRRASLVGRFWWAIIGLVILGLSVAYWLV